MAMTSPLASSARFLTAPPFADRLLEIEVQNHVTIKHNFHCGQCRGLALPHIAACADCGDVKADEAHHLYDAPESGGPGQAPKPVSGPQ